MDKTSHAAFTYIKSSGGIDEYRLQANDLTVLLMEDHSAPVATFMVTYHVGSRNEAVGHTGSTHLLEHMMFKGSSAFNKEKGTTIWTVLQNLGAQINATTWMDRTNYFELLPSEHLETGMRVEADRMRQAFIRDEDRQSEMTVVRNEFERGENEPFSVLDKHIWATAYQAHPYHHSTIGWRSDIENVSTARLKEFYNTFYWPNNATVTVIGDFNTEAALDMINRHFGPLPRSPHPIPEMYTTEPEQEGPRRLIVKRVGQTGIVGVAHKAPDGRQADMVALQVLARILGDGKSSRLYRQIVDTGLATSLYLWDFGFHDPGLLITYAFLTPGTEHERVEKIILAEYENIIANGVTREEVERAKGQIRAEAAYSRDGSYSIASNLNEAIATGDWTLYTTYLETVKKVTAQDIKRVAVAYLVEDHSTTGWFVPELSEDLSAAETGAVHQPQTWRPWDQNEALETAAAAGNAGTRAGTPLAPQIKEQEPLPGLRLLSLQTGVKDVVTIYGSLLGGDRFSPAANPLLADLVAAMLDQGTQKQDKFQISDRLEAVGASLSFSSDDYRVRFSARCLKENVPLVLELLAEQLRVPAFRAEDLETVKKRYIGNLERSKVNTQTRAHIALTQALYPREHTNYRRDIDEDIAYITSIGAVEVQEYHRRNYGLGNLLIVAAGDIEHKDLARGLKKVFEGWKTSPLSMPERTLAALPVKKSARYITIPDKTSLDIYLGQAVGIDRTHADYYSLMIGVYILGGNFSARLMSTVRDEQGLTYGIGSAVAGVDDGNDGFWYTRGTFAPELLEKGLAATLEQLELWNRNGVTAAELAAKKTTLTGSYKVGLATTRGLAGQILTNAERGRPTAFLDEYPGIITALTLEQVNGAIRKYVDLDKLVTTAAGTIDKDGQPVKK